MMVEHNQSANNPTNGGYNNAYKFNGKELDDATGMYYYGARYYDPRISIFVSVDPLAEKFVGRSPYEYCFNNPINLVDPTGMSPTGGPGGPPVKNLYIVLDYHKTGDDGNDAKRDIIRFEGMEEKGWTAFRTNSVREANAIMASKYNDQKFDNIVIETHGSTSGSIENTYSALQSDNNNINSSTRITYKTLSAGGHTSTEALISITNYLNEDGNLIFNSCNLGMDSRFMDEMGKATGNKFNIYYPYGKSQQQWLQSDKEGTAIYSPIKLFNRNILDKNGGYLSPKGESEYKKINSLKINSDGGVQCED